MMDTVREPVLEERSKQARRMAEERFRSEPDWVRFYREVLGVDGVVHSLFPTFDQRLHFEKTPEYAEIQQMVAKLRERNRVQKNCDEPTRVITVRLPQSLHEALRHEAHNHKTSMNKLCISKLLQVIECDLVPSDFGGREDEEESPAPSRSSLTTMVPGPSQPPTMAFSVPVPAPAIPHASFNPRPLTPPPSMPGATF